MFVEKPHLPDARRTGGHRIGVCTRRAIAAKHPLLMVGFNRRFAPQVQKMKALLSERKEPKAFVMTVNAGAIPAEHWTQDPAVGGGRIVGEACHFVDLLRFLPGSSIVSHARDQDGRRRRRHAEPAAGVRRRIDRHHPLLGERIEGVPEGAARSVRGGRILQLDNFRKLTGFGWPASGG